MDRQVHIVRGAFVHTLYWEQLRSCPEGFSYDLSAPAAPLPGLKADLQSHAQLERHRAGLKNTIRKLRRSMALPNVRLVRSRKHLVHSWQYPLMTTAPWVIDFEDAGAFVGYQPVSSRWYAPGVLRALFASPYCRALLPWSQKARDSLVSELGPSLEEKTHVVYPAVSPKLAEQPVAPLDRRLLFVGSAFVSKGGVAAMRAFARVRNELPDARLDMVTFLPPHFRAEAAGIPGLSIHTRAPPEELDRLFRHAYALVAPFGTDTFGYVLLEAFAYGVPAIVSDNFALPELVGRGERGVVVPMSQSLYDAGGRRGSYVPPGPHDRIDGHPLIEAMCSPPTRDID